MSLGRNASSAFVRHAAAAAAASQPAVSTGSRNSVRGLFSLSRVACGTSGDDLVMGERAAQRTNKMVDRLSNMYIGKNHGMDRNIAQNYERVFKGSTKETTPEKKKKTAAEDVLFGPGPLGLEIQWSIPPLVTNVVPGFAGEKAGVVKDSVITHINGSSANRPVPERELEDLLRTRPLRLQLRPRQADDFPDAEDTSVAAKLKPADVVRRLGVTKVSAAISPETAASLLALVRREREKTLEEIKNHPEKSKDIYSKVQTPRADESAPETRWDMRLPDAQEVQDALQELFGKTSTTKGKDSTTLGAAVESLVGGPSSELWELGVLVAEPGARAQPLHFDAPVECLYTIFVALQDITPQMGPTMFLPGTHTTSAHKDYAQRGNRFVEEARATVGVASAGDALLYDSRLLHCGGENVSDKQRVLLYATFKKCGSNPVALGIDQHSIRPELAGKYSLSNFRVNASA